MPTGHVFIAISLDGFVARPDRSLDWLMKQDTGPDDAGYGDFIKDKDGLIMGTGSFQSLLGFEQWPYDKPVVVMSSSLMPDDIPAALKEMVSLSRETPDALMHTLDRKGWTHAYVDGGRVVQAFLRAGLITEMTITLVPILLGDGIRLFGPLDADIDLELLSTRQITSDMISLHYRVRPGPVPTP